MPTNIKKLLLPTTMAKAGWAIVEAREDVEGVPYLVSAPKAEFHRLLADVAGVALSVTPFSTPELDAGADLEVVARIGVGYDAVDVPALSARKIPLMIAGTANSVSVAEAGVFLLMSLARRGAHFDTMVKEGRWQDRYREMPVDLYGRTVLIVGFGKIGTRAARRYAAMEMTVLVYDPYLYSETIRGMGYEPVGDLDQAVARADFITIHCPKTPETVGMFDAARLARMKTTAFLANTARGGIIDETALYDALKANRIAGAALDVFAEEPPRTDNPLLTLPNFLAAPHMAGVTREAVDRMAVVAVQNMLSVLDGTPNRENVINKEVLGRGAERADASRSAGAAECDGSRETVVAGFASRRRRLADGRIVRSSRMKISQNHRDCWIFGENIEVRRPCWSLAMLQELWEDSVVNYENLALFCIGNSKEIRHTKLAGILIGRFLPTLYSYTTNRIGIVAGTDALRMQISRIFWRHLHRVGIRTCYLACSPEFFLVSEETVPPVEVIVKRALVGTPAHIYEGLLNRRDRFGRPFVKGERHPAYVRFDYRNPLLSATGDRLRDEMLPASLADRLIDVKIATGLALEIAAVIENILNDSGFTMLDICLFFDDTGTVLCGEISPDNMRIKSLDNTEDFDKDLWRKHRTGEEIVAQWTTLLSRLTDRN